MNLIDQLPSGIGHIPLKQVILQAGIASDARQICHKLGRTLVICDENTNNFVSGGDERIILPGNQKPELELAKELAKHSPDYFVAVGSGSLNDLVKYASHIAGKPYVVFGTAPSMNGYVSANTSLLENGYKKSFYAHSPESVYLDLEILQNAPRRLINSGIGDSICRGTAQADALLSAQVLNTSDYAELFSLIRTQEDSLFDSVEALTKSLVYSGLAMLFAHSSAPASQSEHMLAHYMELMNQQAPHSYHGEQIAVTTLTMAKMQEKLLAENDYVEAMPVNEQKILTHFGQDFGQYCIEQTRKKYADIKRLKIDKAAIENAMLKSEQIEAKLKSVAAPLTAKNLGWDEEIYANAQSYARYTRDRFTFLDLNY